MRKVIFLLSLIVFACSPNNDDETANTIEIEVSAITDEGATIDWTPPSILESGASVVYKVLLFGDVVADNLTIRTFTFTGLTDNVLYTGSVFALDSNGNETFSEFSFTTVTDPIFNGILTITTQEEADNFYYTWVLALIIDGEDITDLSALQSLEYVERYIEIKNTSAATLEGLQNVQTDTGLFPGLPYLEIKNNSLLENVSAIGDFSQKSTIVNLLDSPLLISLDGLELQEEPKINLRNLGLTNLSHFLTNSEISITLNGLNQLTSLSGLDNIERLNAPFVIENCQNLNTLNGIGTLNFNYGLWLDNNDSLTSLDGLTFLNEGGQIQVEIHNNSNLSDYCSIQSWVENNSIQQVYDGVGDFLFEYYGVTENAYNPTLEQMSSDTECSQ